VARTKLQLISVYKRKALSTAVDRLCGLRESAKKVEKIPVFSLDFPW
jgi:hypothetical protein